MIRIIHYFNPVTTNEHILSIDNVVLDFYAVRPAVTEQLVMLIDRVSIQYNAEVRRWTSFKPGTFNEQTSIKASDDVSFWIGVGLNGKKTAWDRCRAEFNPNKAGDNPVFVRIMSYLLNRIPALQRKVARFDLAIDIPVDREQCFLVKDRRLYIERRHGKEFTQYLGAKSSAVGRVKLYNKTVESGLDYPLTRLELTLDPEIPYENVNFPAVFYLNESTLATNKLKITATECFILNSLLQGYGAPTDLGRKTRVKIVTLMTDYVKYVEVAEDDYKAILTQLNAYLT